VPQILYSFCDTYLDSEFCPFLSFYFHPTIQLVYKDIYELQIKRIGSTISTVSGIPVPLSETVRINAASLIFFGPVFCTVACFVFNISIFVKFYLHFSPVSARKCVFLGVENQLIEDQT
jgi:hypothetical protein